MTAIQIQIKPEDVEAAIVQAVVASSLGKSITDEVNKTTADWKVKEIVSEAIKMRIRQEIHNLMDAPEIKAKIQAIAAGMLTEEVISDIATKGLEALKVSRW